MISVFSDAGFKKEEIDGYALGGGVYLRHTQPLTDNVGNPTASAVDVHLLLAESKSIKTVCRSTYAAELMAAASATDAIIPLTVTMHEVLNGPMGVEQLRKLRDDGC